MSSRFNPRVAQRVTLPVCLKPPPPSGPTQTDGVPTALVAASWWLDPTFTPPIATSAAKTILYDPPTRTWRQPLQQLPTELKVTVVRLLTPGQFDVFVELWQNGVMIDDVSWHDVYINVGPPMRSLKFENQYIPGIAYTGVHLLS